MLLSLSESVFRKAQEGASSYSFLTNNRGASLSLSESVFRKAQKGASSYSFLNNNLQIVYLENPGVASLSPRVYLEKPRRELLGALLLNLFYITIFR